MTKKLLFTILFIIIIGGLGFFVYQNFGDKIENEVQKNTETEGDKLENEVQKNTEIEEDFGYVSPTNQSPTEITSIIDEGIRTQNMSVCEKIKNEDVKKLCVTNATIAKAKVERDTTICDQIEEEEIKIMCKDNVINNKAY